VLSLLSHRQPGTQCKVHEVAGGGSSRLAPSASQRQWGALHAQASSAEQLAQLRTDPGPHPPSRRGCVTQWEAGLV